MATDTMLDRLILNKMTPEQYKAAKEAGTLSDTELYLVDDGGFGGASGDYIPVPTIAEVGQTVVVTEVDNTGKPTAWEAADFPSGVEDFPSTPQVSITLEEATNIVWLKQIDGVNLSTFGYTACHIQMANSPVSANVSGELKVAINCPATNLRPDPHSSAGTGFANQTAQKYWFTHYDLRNGIAYYLTSPITNTRLGGNVQSIVYTNNLFGGKTINDVLFWMTISGQTMPVGTKINIWFR